MQTWQQERSLKLGRCQNRRKLIHNSAKRCSAVVTRTQLVMVTSHPFASWVSNLDIALWNLTEQYAATRVKSHRRQCRHIQWGQLNSIFYYSLPDITYHVAIKTIERIIRLGLRVSNNVTMIICHPLCINFT